MDQPFGSPIKQVSSQIKSEVFLKRNLIVDIFLRDLTCRENSYRNYDQDCHRNFHLHFTSLIIIHISEHTPISGQKSIKQIYNKQSWKLFDVKFWSKENKQIVLTENIFELENIFLIYLLYFCIKCLKKALKLWKLPRYWSLKETGVGNAQKFISTDKPKQQI